MKQVALLLFGLLTALVAQSQFTDITEQFENLGVDLTSPTNGYGNGVSFFDFNKDGWDDISIAGGDNDPVFLVNNQGTLELAPFNNIINPTTARIHSMLWVDYDNDGDMDLFISKNNGPMQLWQNDGNMNMTNVALQAGLEQDNYIYANACWADYDHDGCLDFYVTKNYGFFDYLDTLYTSQLYRNNCDGTFTEVTAEAGVQLIPRSELQPVWVDVNNDGWEDLFIAVDRLPYQNELFVNNGDGTFTNVTEEANVGLFLDAMGCSVADYNHDDYLDIYVGNNPLEPGNAFYENNGDGTFTNIAPEMGLAFGVEPQLSTWGTAWIDYDNDMWEDLFIATMSFTVLPHPGSLLFQNNQGESFTDITEDANINSGVTTETFTLAIGDLNNDGYYDYFTGNRNPYTPRLKINDGGDNNFISVELEGTFANRDGIGTWIRCYVNGNQLVRYTMCGINLAGQNSGKYIFGLAENQQVDSLVLDWNSGTHEVYVNPDINTFHYLIEGASFLEPVEIAFTGELDLCPGNSIELDAGEHEAYLWNTGHTGRYLTVESAGAYFVEAFNEFGLSVISDTISVSVFPTPEPVVNSESISCTGENDGTVEVSLSNGEIDFIVWNHGPETTLLSNLSSGVYSFTVTDTNGCSNTGEVNINEPSPFFAQAVPTDVLCFGDSSGSVELQALGGTPPYTTNWLGNNPDSLSAGIYSAICLDDNGCEVPLSFTIGEPDSIEVTIATTPATDEEAIGTAEAFVTGGTLPYTLTWSNGETDTYNIDELEPGVYTLGVEDGNGCMYELDFVISSTTSVETSARSPLRLFPNPANDVVRITGVTGASMNVDLIDATGRVIWSREQIPAQAELPLGSPSPGSYLLRVYDQKGIHTLRLMISGQ